ncbi:hypothetical protein MTO96_042394 [Rhipicephalus appendiculatus]
MFGRRPEDRALVNAGTAKERCSGRESREGCHPRAQDEAEVRKKVNHEVIVPDEKTCRAGDVPTKRPPTTMSEKRTKSVAHTEHCVVPELAKHQQGTSERDDDLPVSNMSASAETPSTTPFSETARNKKKRKNKKRSSEHRKKGRKRGMRHAG